MTYLSTIFNSGMNVSFVKAMKCARLHYNKIMIQVEIEIFLYLFYLTSKTQIQ